jgi:hypothetical protein
MDLVPDQAAGIFLAAVVEVFAAQLPAEAVSVVGPQGVWFEDSYLRTCVKDEVDCKFRVLLIVSDQGR